MKNVTEILNEGADTYQLKNKDYGESWKNIGHILYTLARGEPVVLETPEDYIALGLFTRRLDKFARSFNGEFLADEMNFESASDADEDEAVYAAMQAENKHDRAEKGTTTYTTEKSNEGEPIYEAGSADPVDHIGKAKRQVQNTFESGHPSHPMDPDEYK